VSAATVRSRLMWAGVGTNRDRAEESMVTLLVILGTTDALGRLDESGGAGGARK
jgi:hypothetical protein